jgi:hypothetical protein
MALVARASTTVRNKNLLIILMCAVFFAWFAYDGYVGYPRRNDRIVERMKGWLDEGKIDPEFDKDIRGWQGWSNETPEARERMDKVVASSKNRVKVEEWKAVLDISVQRWIVLGLAGATAGSIWWFFHCQRRRAIGEETTVSPAEGVVVPWDKITRVDNTRWKSTGIVEITFPGPDGKPQKAKFDDYELEREPLLEILDQLAIKAVNAEFIPRDEPAPAEPAPPPVEKEPTKP